MSYRDTARSPYSRHNKTPHHYSEAYQRWRNAMARHMGDSSAPDVQEADEAFRRKYSLPSREAMAALNFLLPDDDARANYDDD